jgi:hypothetical protein
MISWVTEMLERTVPLGQHLLLATVLLIAGTVLSFAIIFAVLIRLPADHFAPSRGQGGTNVRRGFLAWAGIVVKNLLGAAIVALGVILSVPGIPGQGLLTIFAGLLLLDFPGKHQLLVKILSRPAVLRSINRLRAKYGRLPLVIGPP